MNLPRLLLAGLLMTVFATTGWGQAPGPVPPRMPPPLWVRLAGAQGLRAIFHSGGMANHNLDAPATVALRPGYIYRLELIGFPKYPGVSLFPTLEVRGTLLPPPWVDPAKYPVPVALSTEEVDRVMGGAFLTKVYYLEHPDQALPLPSTPEMPVETEIPPSRDPVDEARLRGRPVLVMRVGLRDVEPAELARQTIPGTILFPGEGSMGPPAAPPTLPAVCWDWIDPRLGPKIPQEECIKDGGDAGVPVGLGPDGRLRGLDPADTVAEYTDCKGLRRLAVSNRVCLFAPRFSVLRTEVAPAGAEAVQTVNRAEVVIAQVLLRERQQSQEARQITELLATRGQLRASEYEGVQGLVQVEQYIGLVEALGRIGTAEVVGVCPPPCLPVPDRPLVLCKWADRQAVKVGEIVTFYLKYTNQGFKPITDVAVSDSLTGRLEYVPGSAQADREAVFTTKVNEAGSVILRWQIGGTLAPGKSGILRFQARVR